MVFAADGFVGASPELLVARAGERVWSQPLAGTAPRHGRAGSDVDAESSLLSSAKERQEHRLVVDAVGRTLARFCHVLEVPEVPSLVPIGIVAHLGSAIEGRLVGPFLSVLELVSALHPTPAVAGTPTEDALAHIAAVEGVDRGRYAGPVGWVDAAGDGEWAVGIRSAEIAGSNARLLAGAGIVAESVAEAELAETELKLQPMLNAIVRP
jgi:isochorismate synthase